MSRDASSYDENAANTDQQNAEGALGSYNSDIADYMGNVNSAIAAGNPYESKDYLTEQNLATSGAMNSADTSAKENLGRDVATTGENSASLANTIADTARTGQRDLTSYDAARDASNETSWLGERDNLMRDQLAGAQSEEGVLGTETQGQDAAMGDYTTASDAEDQMWANLAGSAMGGAGTGLGLAFSH